MAATFILDIGNRDYTEWKLTQVEKSSSISQPKLTGYFFHHDIIDQNGVLVRSPYREREEIGGVLLISEKTYGRAGTSRSKLLYKCVPNDKHLPCFLIPYEDKQLGFSKHKVDKYITFAFKEWTSQNKHPIGLLKNTIGDVDQKEAYATYQMLCKEINDSLKQLNAASLRVLRENTLQPVPFAWKGKPIEDRRSFPIISIDPVGCKDIDDALGIQHLNDTIILSIYIANVPLMLEYLKLWPLLTNRIATIYLPHAKYPMLPVALSENVCSLREKEARAAFVLDVHIQDKQIKKIDYKPVIIQVEKNYAYDEQELLMREDYKRIFKTVSELNNNQTRKVKNIRYVDKITNSHDIVEYCMLLMNHQCAELLEADNVGIFRAATIQASAEGQAPAAQDDDYENLPQDLRQILQNVSGEYCSYINRQPHDLIAGGLDVYTHVTSPIRRLVDCINMLYLQQDEIEWSAEAYTFLRKWKTADGIATINTKTKAIRKIQNQMELFELYEKNSTQIYTGTVFAKVTKAHGYKYKAYIRSLKLLTEVISSKDLPEYSPVDFSVHLFMDETKMAKKIRLQIL